MIKQLIVGASLVITCSAHADPLSPDRQHQILNAAARLIEDRYVDSHLAKSSAAAIRRSEAEWSVPLEPEQFAAKATAWLRVKGGDRHFGIDYSASPLSGAAQSDEADFDAKRTERLLGEKVNYGIDGVQRLQDNIMLLTLHSFAPLSSGGDIVAAAMTLVAQGDALIIDLRNNGGGADAGDLIAAYLLPAGSPLSGFYDRPSGLSTSRQTPAWVPGRRFGPKKPVYILTSHRTFSAAEALAYDLQALGRASIVGEQTAGGANPFEYRRLDDHFFLRLPESRPVNPITKTNWEGSGVHPNVVVPADQALTRALELARAARPKS
jgi:hypothetical protein